MEAVYEEALKQVLEIREKKQYFGGNSSLVEQQLKEAEGNLDALQAQIWSKKAEAERMRVIDQYGSNTIKDFGIEEGEKKCQELQQEI